MGRSAERVRKEAADTLNVCVESLEKAFGITPPPRPETADRAALVRWYGDRLLALRAAYQERKKAKRKGGGAGKAKGKPNLA